MHTRRLDKLPAMSVRGQVSGDDGKEILGIALVTEQLIIQTSQHLNPDIGATRDRRRATDLLAPSRVRFTSSAQGLSHSTPRRFFPLQYAKLLCPWTALPFDYEVSSLPQVPRAERTDGSHSRVPKVMSEQEHCPSPYPHVYRSNTVLLRCATRHCHHVHADGHHFV